MFNGYLECNDPISLLRRQWWCRQPLTQTLAASINDSRQWLHPQSTTTVLRVLLTLIRAHSIYLIPSILACLILYILYTRCIMSVHSIPSTPGQVCLTTPVVLNDPTTGYTYNWVWQTPLVTHSISKGGGGGRGGEGGSKEPIDHLSLYIFLFASMMKTHYISFSNSLVALLERWSFLSLGFKR